MNDLMIDLSVITFTIITAITVSIISFIIIRGRFIRKQKVLEEQVKCKVEIIEGMEKTVRRTQAEKEQFLTRAIKAETQLVMVKVAMAETRENSNMMDEITVEDVDLARQILEVDSKIILSKL
jgi:membrane glycosyltransferase